MEYRTLLATPDPFGEGPLWDDQAQVLYRTDMVSNEIHRLDPATGEQRTYAMPTTVACIVLDRSGGAIVTLSDRVVRMDLGSGAVTDLVDPEGGNATVGYNDGRVDAAGRFFFGSYDVNEAEPLGGLFRLDPDGTCARLDSQVMVANGIDWSNDGRTMYFVDSGVHAIWAYDYDPATGAVANRRVFAQNRPGEGMPDGLTVDADDHVWSAEYDGGRVVRYAPDGSTVEVVELPVQRPTAVAFGGPDLDVLYVTSVRDGLDGAALTAQPLAGQLFELRPGVKGRSQHRFAG